MGTMQELWVEPVSLIPKGMPSEISHAIFFEPSARYSYIKNKKYYHKKNINIKNNKIMCKLLSYKG